MSEAALRRPLRPFTASSFLRAIPGLASRVRRIPEAYVHEAGAVVSAFCPCDRKPRLKYDHFTRCECGRVYLYAGEKQLYVGLTPAPTTQEVPA